MTLQQHEIGYTLRPYSYLKATIGSVKHTVELHIPCATSFPIADDLLNSGNERRFPSALLGNVLIPM
jgi:hypothetical protein